MIKNAFTLIEMVFVIVIVGILGNIGADIFVSIYSSYYQSKIQNDLEEKSQLALDQIANRLSYRIKASVIESNATGYTSIESANGAINGKYAIEWIAYDNDAFRGETTAASPNYTLPGWSGFIDLNAITDGINLSSPGSNFLSIAAPIILSETNGTVNLANDANGVAIIFPDAPGSVNDYGWHGSIATLVHPVYAVTETTLTSPTLSGRNFQGTTNEVYETYKMVTTASALEYDPATNDLTFYTNYRPWNGETFAANGTASLFLEDVSTFKLLQVGDILKIQLCVQTPAAFTSSGFNDNNYSICKEKAIF